MKSTKLLIKILFSKYILDIIPKYIYRINLYKDELYIYVKPIYIEPVVFFLKNHKNCKFEQLVDICGVDYPNKRNRFEIIYTFLSIAFNFRLHIKTTVNEITPVNSISLIFNSGLWLEREVWDMFGIFFSNHPDLRRILTDYGFEGYPFRKDFPQIGFVEVRYDDKKKHVLYEPVELAQEYRLFNFLSPWIQVK